MIRRAVSTGEDSDDERVTFDDEIVEGSQQDYEAPERIEVTASKHKHLLQYRKFKGDLDNDIDDDSLSSWNVVGTSSNKNIDFDLNSFVSKAPIKVPNVIDRSIPSKSSVVSKPPQVTTSKVARDVAVDRPGHWKSATLSKVKADPKRQITGDTKRPKVSHATSTFKPSSAKVGGATGFSFQPSWMQSAAASSSSSASSNNRNSLDRSAVEDISEDMSDIYSGAPDVAMNQDDHWVVPMTPQRTPGPVTGVGNSSGGGFSQSFHHSGGSGGGGSHRKYTQKARPGSIKAKYQKIMRDVDAGENRMLSIPPIHLPIVKSSPVATTGPTDMQDPRCRAHRLVDVELVQILSDQSPFRVASGMVLFSQTKKLRFDTPTKLRSVEVSVGSGGIAYHNVEDDREELHFGNISNVEDGAVSSVSGMVESVATAIDLEVGNKVTPPTEKIDEVNKEITSNTFQLPSLEEGTQCTIYFKPNTCAGSGRTLKEGLVLRIYDPEVMRESDKKNLILICTQCWEPACGGSVNSL